MEEEQSYFPGKGGSETKQPTILELGPTKAADKYGPKFMGLEVDLS